MFGALTTFALVAFVLLIACDLIAYTHRKHVSGSAIRIPVPIWQQKRLESRSFFAT